MIQAEPTLAERNRQVVLEYLEGHRPDLLAEDAVFTNLSTGDRYEGREQIGGMLDWLYHVAFDARVDDARIIAGDDGVVLVGTFAGRHIKAFAGVEGTGRDVRVPLVVIYDVADGQVTAARFLFDAASFLAQASG